MPRSEAPLIAVNGTVDAACADEAVFLRTRYAAAIIRAGGLPLVIPPVGSRAALERLLARVDGLLLPGGDDFDTERLGLGPTHPAARVTPSSKQDFDVALAQVALALDVPVLGICYGMQLLVLADGGDLYQHLQDDLPGARDHARGELHDVCAAPGTKLAALLGVEPLPALSRHHQAVARPGSRFTVCARDDEGLIEAVERPDLAFALGVQWHPELAPEGSAHERLFRALVAAAAARAARPDHGPDHALRHRVP